MPPLLLPVTNSCFYANFCPWGEGHNMVQCCFTRSGRFLNNIKEETCMPRGNARGGGPMPRQLLHIKKTLNSVATCDMWSRVSSCVYLLPRHPLPPNSNIFPGLKMKTMDFNRSKFKGNHIFWETFSFCGKIHARMAWEFWMHLSSCVASTIPLFLCLSYKITV